MDGTAGDLDAVFEGLRLGIEAGKGGEQRGMDVEDAVGEGGDKLRGQEAHVAGQADQVDAMCAKAGEDVGIVFGAGTAAGNKEGDGEAEIAGRGDAGRIGDVGDDDGDLDAGEAALAYVAVDGEEVGAAAGEEDAEAERVGLG